MQDKIQNLLNQSFENTQIVSMTYENSGRWDSLTDLPPFYRVRFQTSCGSRSLIFTELWLPEDWNGVYVAYGNGGMAGSIQPRVLAAPLRSGYAAAQTDMGTSLGERSGIRNPDVWKDFGWRATHVMAQVGRAMIFSHYGRYPDHTYFDGASTGGQQALAAAQRFPGDFDGILAAVPANNRVFLHCYFLWYHNHLRKEDGTVLFTPEQVSAITRTAADFFQTRGDGETGDGFVTFPYTDENTVADFLTFLKARKPEFIGEQIEALRAVYEGPRNPVTRKQIYNGMPIGAEMYGCGILDCQKERSPHDYPFLWALGEAYQPYAFDFDRDLETVSAALSAELNANNPDLSAFFARGGKLIAYSGSADPCVPFPDAMQYYERVLDAMGGYGPVSQSFRYFLVPGRDHGDAGLGANRLWRNAARESLLDALRLWTEQGLAPDSLVAERHQDGAVIFSRTLYPYGSRENPCRPFMACCDDDYLSR